MIKLSKQDIEFLITHLSLSQGLRKKLVQLQTFKIKTEDITEDEYDFLRDKCGERLQIYGFDKNYEPTEEGRILEDLIDKLYVG